MPIIEGQKEADKAGQFTGQFTGQGANEPMNLVVLGEIPGATVRSQLSIHSKRR